MRKPDIFDEIILFLRESSIQNSSVEISPAILNDLYQPVPTHSPERKSPTPQTPSGFPPDTASQNIKQTSPASVELSSSVHPPLESETLKDVSQLSWEELKQRCFSCRNCKLCSTRTHVVFEDGNRQADLMFIGEGPGADEDAQGIPFVGRAGQLLTKMIAAMQFDRKTEVYIANIVKCRPPNNRNPEPDEAAACIGYLKRQIELVQPKAIVLLGAVPLLHLMHLKGISRLRGTWLDYNGIKVMPTYHPAYLLRNANEKINAWKDLQMVMKVFGKTPPPPRSRRTETV